MGDCDDEQSPNPMFWLEFRTFDDGLPSVAHHTLRPPFSSFPQFVRLPAELRLKIWEYLVQPRIVVACCLQRDQRLEDRRRELRSRTRASATPALLGINREARSLGRRHYELAFGWRISKLLSDTPVSSPARTWFNFSQDALYLTGELEAFDTHGFNSPMVYFLGREEAARVRHVACAFAALGYPEQESDQVFGCLWHVVDRFPAAARLLLTVVAGDEELIGGGARMLSPDNVVQKIWNGWMCGTTVTSSRMAGKQMLLVREDDLPGFMASQ